MDDLGSSDLSPEELANQIDQALAGDGNAPFSSNYPTNDPRVHIAIRLANANHPQMSPEMQARIQSKVVAAHRQQIKRQRGWHPQITIYARLAAAVVIIAIFFGATALPALANSVPGDFWYPFKRNLENIELSIAPSSAARAGVYLTQAERRVEEAQVLLQRNIFDTNLMLDARNNLTSFNKLSNEVNNPSPDGEARAALVTESISILLQEAEQAQILSGNQVTLLLPTIIPVLPSNTPTPTLVPSATMTPTNSSSPLAEVTEIQPTAESIATEEPTQIIETDTPTPSVTPSALPSATSSVTPSATAQPPVQIMYAIENANVRNLPGQNQTILTILRHGESTEVVGEDDTGRWWHVKLVDGRQGWIAKFLLSTELPPPPADNNSSNTQGNCDHPGNYCNAPGQTGTLPAQAGGNSGSNNGKPGNPPGNNGNPPSTTENGHKP